jgi:hypothetical protein
MQVMKRLVFMGLGIALTGYLSGATVFAADKPIEDGSKIVITSPKAGDKVSDTFELKYELTKGSQAAHAVNDHLKFSPVRSSEIPPSE